MRNAERRVREIRARPVETAVFGVVGYLASIAVFAGIYLLLGRPVEEDAVVGFALGAALYRWGSLYVAIARSGR